MITDLLEDWTGRCLLAVLAGGLAGVLYGLAVLADRVGVEYEPTPARVQSTAFTDGHYQPVTYSDGKTTTTTMVFYPPEWHAYVLPDRGDPVRCEISEADFIRLRPGDTVTARLIVGRFSGETSCLRGIAQ